MEIFAKKLKQRNKDSSNRISQLQTCSTATLDEFEHYIYQAISPYTKKEEIGMLKRESDTLKEEIANSNKICFRKKY